MMADDDRSSTIRTVSIAGLIAVPLLLGGSYVRQEVRRTCVYCAATSVRTTWYVAGIPYVNDSAPAGTKATVIYEQLVSPGCEHIWGGGPGSTVSHFLFIPVGTRRSEEPGGFPSYRYTVMVLLAVAKLDEHAFAAGLYRWLTPSRPKDGLLKEQYVKDFKRCQGRFYRLFPGGGVPEVVRAADCRRAMAGTR